MLFLNLSIISVFFSDLFSDYLYIIRITTGNQIVDRTADKQATQNFYASTAVVKKGAHRASKFFYFIALLAFSMEWYSAVVR